MRREPIRFTRGRREYVITTAYGAHNAGFIGLCNGQVVAFGAAPAEVARDLIRGSGRSRLH